jgi:hypothetical protein
VKIHHREAIVQKAEADVMDVFVRSKLTLAEQVRVCSSIVAHCAKWLIRDERHPDDPDTPGGLEEES